MTIRNRWMVFVCSIAKRIELNDPQGALLFKTVNEANIPPNEASLEWGMAYIKAQQAMLELMTICTQQGRVDDGIIISHYMLELNKVLSERRDVVRVPREFVKEVSF